MLLKYIHLNNDTISLMGEIYFIKWNLPLYWLPVNSSLLNIEFVELIKFLSFDIFWFESKSRMYEVELNDIANLNFGQLFWIY